MTSGEIGGCMLGYAFMGKALDAILRSAETARREPIRYRGEA
jgi:hypothetical protein